MQDACVTETLLTAKDVAGILCISQRTVWRYVAEGRIPSPVKITRTTVRWKASQLQAYLDKLNSTDNPPN